MSGKVPVSVIIIAYNEEDRLPATLASLDWADQVVVVDSGSIDSTRELAAAAGADVAEHPWEGYSKQKQFALTLTRHTWVLWLDADEVVSGELAASISAALEIQGTGDGIYAAYSFNRRTSYLGRLLRFGGWYPDRKVRLFNKELSVFDGALIHEGLIVDGEIGFLRGDLYHFSYRDLDHHISKTHEFAQVWPEQHHDSAPVRNWEMIVHPAAKAIKSYFVRGGLLEGWRGMILAGMASYSVWLKYALLREKQQAASIGSVSSGEGCDDPGER